MAFLNQSPAHRYSILPASTNGLQGKPDGWQVKKRQVPRAIIPIRSWRESEAAVRRPPYVQIVSKPNGRQYCYFRRRGRPRVDLPALNDPSFEQAYAQALLIEPPPTGSSLRPAAAGTFDALAIRYYASPTFTELSPITQKDYRKHIEKMREEFGDLLVKRMSRAFVFEHRDRIAREHGLRTAAYRIVVLRLLLNQAINYGFRPDNYNPANKPELRRNAPRDQVWTADNETKFLAACEATDQRPTRPHMRLAYYLAVYTVQRQTDILELGRVDYDGKQIALTQSKGGKRIWVPCHERLRDVLDVMLARMPSDQTAFLVTRSGGPMDEHYLRHEWRKVTLAAGLDGLLFRDLRRTGMVRMAEAGATAVQISAVSGHSIEQTTRILETYIPRNAKMAAGAIKLQEQADRKRLKKGRDQRQL
jgi:integrase